MLDDVIIQKPECKCLSPWKRILESHFLNVFTKIRNILNGITLSSMETSIIVPSCRVHMGDRPLSRPPPTSAAGVQYQFTSCWLYGGQMAFGGRFSPRTTLPLPILIPPNVPYSYIVRWLAGTIGQLEANVHSISSQGTKFKIIN
jgi:hypothetical protein